MTTETVRPEGPVTLESELAPLPYWPGSNLVGSGDIFADGSDATYAHLGAGQDPTFTYGAAVGRTVPMFVTDPGWDWSSLNGWRTYLRADVDPAGDNGTVIGVYGLQPGVPIPSSAVTSYGAFAAFTPGMVTYVFDWGTFIPDFTGLGPTIRDLVLNQDIAVVYGTLSDGPVYADAADVWMEFDFADTPGGARPKPVRMYPRHDDRALGSAVRVVGGYQ